MANRKLGLNLPSDVITDILCQFPVKTLLRFRCASKRWCSQIDSPDFIKLHLSHSLATKSNRSLLLLKYWNEIYSVEFDSLRTHIATELNPPIILKDEMIGCIVSLPCNGLVAVWRWNIRYLEMTLWNPSTRKHQRLPRIRTSTPCNALIGLGHDPISDDYKVMVQHHNSAAAAAAAYGLFGVKVYSLKTNSWREINELPNYFLPHLVPDQSNRRSRFGAFASGALHWVSTHPGEFGRHCTIVAFDLAVEEFRIVPQPDDHDHVDIDGGLEMHLGVLEGRLCMICNYDSECFDVWVMKEYGLKESWTKLFGVCSQSSTFNRTFQQVMPLAYSESGDKVLLEVDDTDLYWYDFRRKRAERVRNIQRYPNYFTIADVYVESLVPLAGGGLTLDDRKTQQPQEEKIKEEL